jgi:hypothetical protein
MGFLFPKQNDASKGTVRHFNVRARDLQEKRPGPVRYVFEEVLDELKQTDPKYNLSTTFLKNFGFIEALKL